MMAVCASGRDSGRRLDSGGGEAEPEAQNSCRDFYFSRTSIHRPELPQPLRLESEVPTRSPPSVLARLESRVSTCYTATVLPTLCLTIFPVSRPTRRSLQPRSTALRCSPESLRPRGAANAHWRPSAYSYESSNRSGSELLLRSTAPVFPCLRQA